MKHVLDQNRSKPSRPSRTLGKPDAADAPPDRRLSVRFRHTLFLALFGCLVGSAFGISVGLSRDLPQIANLENFKPMLDLPPPTVPVIKLVPKPK